MLNIYAMYTLYPEEPIVIYIFHIFRIQLIVRSQSLLSLPMKRKTVELSITSTIISGNSIQIIKRYERFQENKLVFPNLNYWNICKPLKKRIKECGITKGISFHSSRHGFATLALSKGVPIESVSRVLGHTNITTTQKYAKITTEKIDKDLTMFGNRLNQSFSEISIAMQLWSEQLLQSARMAM